MAKREASLAGMKINEDEIVSALLGLTYSGGQQMLRLAFDKFGKTPGRTEEILGHLNRKKEEMLARTLGMSILKPTSDDIPYGLDHLLHDLTVHRKLICAEGQSREKGWLLIGTPGSGKSLLAKYLGFKLGYPALSFNISSIMNSLVGQTEKNMHNLCQVLETYAPCVLYIDEFEKALGGGHELDGGTMTRALGILFTWLNDTNAPIFLLGSANNLDKTVGLALTRRGRFSQLYWVGEPCRQARFDICRATFSRRKVMIPETVLNELADKTRYFSGADLVWMINEAITESEYYKHASSDPKFREKLFDLVEKNRSRVEMMKMHYDELREWGKAYCKPAGLPPEA